MFGQSITAGFTASADPKVRFGEICQFDAAAGKSCRYQVGVNVELFRNPLNPRANVLAFPVLGIVRYVDIAVFSLRRRFIITRCGCFPYKLIIILHLPLDTMVIPFATATCPICYAHLTPKNSLFSTFGPRVHQFRSITDNVRSLLVLPLPESHFRSANGHLGALASIDLNGLSVGSELNQLVEYREFHKYPPMINADRAGRAPQIAPQQAVPKEKRARSQRRMITMPTQHSKQSWRVRPIDLTRPEIDATRERTKVVCSR